MLTFLTYLTKIYTADVILILTHTILTNLELTKKYILIEKLFYICFYPLRGKYVFTIEHL